MHNSLSPRRHSGQLHHPRRGRGARDCGGGLPDCREHAGIGLGCGELFDFCGDAGARLLCSTLYHSLVRTRARHVFHVLDHGAIYLLIAGTYTPFTLVSLRGPVGWTLFGIVWTLAIAGVIFKSFAVGRFAVASAVVYLFQGWLVIFAARPLMHAISPHGLMWLGAGGLAYTLGVVFFALDRIPLLPCRLASVCSGRKHCALRRHPFLCGASGLRTGRNLCSITISTHYFWVGFAHWTFD